MSAPPPAEEKKSEVPANSAAPGPHNPHCASGVSNKYIMQQMNTHQGADVVARGDLETFLEQQQEKARQKFEAATAVAAAAAGSPADKLKTAEGGASSSADAPAAAAAGSATAGGKAEKDAKDEKARFNPYAKFLTKPKAMLPMKPKKKDDAAAAPELNGYKAAMQQFKASNCSSNEDGNFNKLQK